MADTANQYHLLVFDPGGCTGWAEFVVDCHAFSRPDHKILTNIIRWDCGELRGTEIENLVAVSNKLLVLKSGTLPYNEITQVISEDFQLTQMIGGKELLSPVRINAVIQWECHKQGIPFELQSRTMRTLITRERLKRMGFPAGLGKDEFAAMQHAITWLKRVKADSMANPWKLSRDGHTNAYYDCACVSGTTCDIVHP